MSRFPNGRRLPFTERFWRMAQKGTPDECWHWLGSRDKHGYGRIFVKDRVHLATRVSYLLEHGELPQELCVCHRCDNPSCVNPQHLFLGTHRDNTHDMIRKGRRVLCVGSAKYSAVQIAEILDLRKGGAKLHEIAEKFGCAISTASRICSGSIGSPKRVRGNSAQMPEEGDRA